MIQLLMMSKKTLIDEHIITAVIVLTLVAIDYIRKENLKLQRNLQYFSVGCQQLNKAKQVMEELVA